MNAETVHSVAKALSREEFERFYLLILKDLEGEKKEEKKKEKLVKRNTRTPIITDAESMEAILRILKRTKDAKFKHLRVAC
ncbi:hypothetical protein [Flavobacterium aestivum]|uniref:hypothetical protein n=1 Tax=Flavobacterium aestivum TaxID=3003257 RepID=UPI0022864128|nr:hypothetical protein [Flavobacterium aestivum]